MTHAPTDPVTALLHRHRDLCERAVDPMEIAALLEARGVTDRTAARFRHRDVFSLAEELYARVPRVVDSTSVVGEATPDAARGHHRLRGLLADLLPVALGASAVAVPLLADRLGPLPGGTGAVAALTALTTAAALLALGAVLRRRLPGGRCAVAALTASAGAVLLVGFGLGGAWLLAEVTRGAALPGVEAARGAAQAALVLTAAVAPALWSADRFTAGARRRLAGSRTLRELTSATRPLLGVVVAGFAAVLAGLLTAAVQLPRLLPGGPSVWPTPSAANAAAVLAVGLLLQLVLLLACGGRRTAAAAGLAGAAAALTAAVSLLAASWLPGLRWLALPVESVVTAGGTALLTASAAGAAWLVLLVVAGRTLTGPWAHHRARCAVTPAGGVPPGPAAGGDGCRHGGRGPVGHEPPAGWEPVHGESLGGRRDSPTDCASAATPAVPATRR